MLLFELEIDFHYQYSSRGESLSELVPSGLFCGPVHRVFVGLEEQRF
jgi:hypothetical protein